MQYLFDIFKDKMKVVIAALLATSASATWGTWDSSNYCDFGQQEIDSVSFTAEEASMMGMNKQVCADLCATMDQNALHIPYGTDECCDYEGWADGSADCTLYLGNDTMPNEFNGHPDEYEDSLRFGSMTFKSGENALASGIGKREPSSR